MSNSYFLTGIGTDVGKTVVSAILCELLQASYWKPIQAGDLQNSDSKKIQEWLNNTVEIIPEAHLFSEALSPHVASKIDGVSINPAMLNLPKTTGNLISSIKKRGDVHPCERTEEKVGFNLYSFIIEEKKTIY